MSNQKITRVRLQKQEYGFKKQPMENAFVKRQGYLNFYFCIYNLDGDFKDGFYFGLLQLHQNYPFAAPKLFFYTPNGRYEVNLAICTSFTNYHQQSWTSAWNVRSLIQGTISFMYSNQASYGCRHDDSLTRKKLAKQSLGWNMQNTLFVSLFGQTLKDKLLDLAKLGISIHDQTLRVQLYQNKQYKELKLENKIELNNVQTQIVPPVQHQIRHPINREQQIAPLPELDQLDLRQNLIHRGDFGFQDDRRRRNRNKTIKKVIAGGVVFGIGIVLFFRFR